jgi:hypothetical protein
MMRKSILAGIVAIMVLAAIGYVAVAQEKEAPKEPMAGMAHHTMAHPEAAKPAAETPAPTAMTPEEMAKAGHERAAKMGMSEGMIMRHKMMNTAAIAKDDPASVLALKGDLALTPEQVKKIESIAAKAREETEALLTAEQKKKLEPLAGTPETMMGMQEEMRSKMGGGGMMSGPGGPGGRGGEGGGMGRMGMSHGGSSQGGPESKPAEGAEKK